MLRAGFRPTNTTFSRQATAFNFGTCYTLQCLPSNSLQYRLTSADFGCARDLYLKIKSTLCDPLLQSKLHEVMDVETLLETCIQVDQTFEVLMSDNPATQKLFLEMTKLAECQNVI
jgi:hypothetical protein